MGGNKWKGCGWRQGTEPDGFRGIKWGTDLTAPGPTLISFPRSTSILKSVLGEVGAYLRENDELRIGEATLEEILYFFCQGKFYRVIITAKGFENYEALRLATFEKFGEGFHEREGKWESYIWLGDKTSMVLMYKESSEGIQLTLFSKEHLKREESYKEQKAKEGAETGF